MWGMMVYVAVLFYLLTPGVLVSLPPGGSRTTVALTHAVVFSLVWCYTHKVVYGLVGK
jgi:hypothetical protein